MSTGLISGRRLRPWSLPAGAKGSWTPEGHYIGAGARSPLEVAVVRCPSRPSDGEVRALWSKRRGNTPSPLLLVALWPSGAEERATACGPSGQDPPVYTDRDVGQIARIADAALTEPDHHAASRFLAAYLPEEKGGLRNVALFASHHLTQRMPTRPDWAQLCEAGGKLLGKRKQGLVEALGFTLETRGPAALLRSNGQASALAVFLDDAENPDASIARFNGLSPVSWAIASATSDNIPYVLVSRGPQLRLYTTRAGAGIGGKGGSSAFLEVNLSLLTAQDAGYLPLLFSAESLGSGGTFETMLAESNDFATDLGSRLRARVYDHSVPALAEALIAHHNGSTEPDVLADLYEQALLILFRLLFVAYAEDRDLLPLRTNSAYRQRSLKQIARTLAARNRGGQDPTAFDAHSTDLWDNLTALWTAVDKGRAEWNVPAYNGGMFSSEPDDSPNGSAVGKLALTDAQLGPALAGLLVDESIDGVPGPVDFASLDVREFGTIYEGLLESSLSVAPTDLKLNTDDTWVPAGAGDVVRVHAGSIYLHNSGGKRKASGSYFTKPFAVNHLLNNALDRALDAHLGRLRVLLEAGNEASAAESFFDFRCVDLAMGSGHFLVAAVDVIERRLSAFLAEHSLGRVLDELARLGAAAQENLEAAGIAAEYTDTNALLRRQIGRRCIYGVDLNATAVELARLALWVHTFVKGLPLTNLNHGLVEGNSLTGIGTLDEIVQIFDPTAADGSLSMFTAAFDDALGEATSAIHRFSATSEANAAEVKVARQAHAEATTALADTRRLFDYATAVRLKLAPGLTVTSIDDVAKAAAAFDPSCLGAVQPLHFPLVFPEVFTRERPGFDCVLGNPPWEEATLEEPGYWARHFPGLRSMTASAQTQRIRELHVERPDLHEDYQRERSKQDAVRAALMAGPYPGMGTGDPDLYKGFIWRFVQLTRRDGYLGVVLPRQALAAAGSAPWRRYVLEHAAFDDLCLLVNSRLWVFPEVHPQYTFALCSLVIGKNHSGTVRLRGPYTSEERFNAGVGTGYHAEVDAAALAGWTENATIPLVPSEDAMRVFLKLRAHPRLDADQGWRARPATELHATNEKGEMLLDMTPNGSTLWPVYKGESFDIWKPDSGTYYAAANAEHIQQYLYEKRIRQQKLARSPFSAFPKRWAQDRSTLHCLAPRIAFRDVSRATDSRTVRAALIPPHCVVANQAPFLLWPSGTSQDEAYLLGVMCSVPFDWYARRIVENHLNFHIFNAFPVPRPAAEDPLRRRVVESAGRLAAVDDRYATWAAEVGVPVGSVATESEKSDLIAELDAAVALLYGLDDADISTCFESFHEGWAYRDRLTAVLDHANRLRGIR